MVDFLFKLHFFGSEAALLVLPTQILGEKVQKCDEKARKSKSLNQQISN